jgi:hypothetical protein
VETGGNPSARARRWRIRFSNCVSGQRRPRVAAQRVARGAERQVSGIRVEMRVSERSHIKRRRQIGRHQLADAPTKRVPGNQVFAGEETEHEPFLEQRGLKPFRLIDQISGMMTLWINLRQRI